MRYYEECHKLDLKYEALYAENNRQRQKIVEGEYEPTGNELEWKDEVLQEVIDKLEKEGNRAKLEERNSQLPLGEKYGGGDVVEEA